MCSQPNRYAEVLRKLTCSVKLWVDLKLLHIATYIKGNISGAFKCNIYLKSSKPTTLSKFIDEARTAPALSNPPQLGILQGEPRINLPDDVSK